MLRLKTTFRAALLALAMIAACALPSATKADTLTGAGSTFINPIMTKWESAYKAETGTAVNYQSIGSGGGIQALLTQTVDFAGSDVPMNAGEKAQAHGGVIHVPDILGAEAVSYNIPGIGPGIHLTGPVIADIFLGKITYWDDPAITKLSPGTNFPHESILVVHRSDGSGTTYIWTDYLSKVSTEWRNSVGAGKSVNWPTGLGGKGNAGVAGFIKNKPYSIGYLELAYAIQNVIYYAAVSNKRGEFVYPSEENTALAAVGQPVPSNLEMSITNTSSPGGYPIAGYSYLIVPAHSSKAAALKQWVTWVVTTGQDASITKPLHFAPIPAAVRDRALQIIAKL